MVVGVVGDADEAGDVEFEYVVGGVSGWEESGLDHAEALRDGGWDDGFNGEALRDCVKLGMGLVVVLGSGIGVADVEAAALMARFETISTGYEGYVSCGFVKSFLTARSKRDRVSLSTVSSQSR
jgi:hypothetical protein